MTELPENGVTLDWIGRTLVEMQREQRGIRDEVTGIREEVAEIRRVQQEHDWRLRDIESALFRVDAVWRDIQAGIREVLRHLKPRVQQP